MNTTDLRILLWDIDGTILRSARATTFTEYTRPVLESVFGTAGRIYEVPLTGMTDLQYIAESLSCEGITREAIFERIGEISACYFCEIERAASNGAEFHVFSHTSNRGKPWSELNLARRASSFLIFGHAAQAWPLL